MEITQIEATTIPDAWFQVIYNLLAGPLDPNIYKINSGSYVGQMRIEYDYLVLHVSHPFVEPFAPDIPGYLNIPPPVEGDGVIARYFADYLTSRCPKSNETYIYGSWIVPSINRIVEQLSGGPGTNQATISLGGISPVSQRDTDDHIDPGTGERDPACLRVIDFRIDSNNTLSMFLYFRSWDLWGGLPANLGGLELLKQHISYLTGTENGSIVVTSKGAHIYEHVLSLAAKRIGLQDIKTVEDFMKYRASR